jgi:hypothetical protein
MSYFSTSCDDGLTPNLWKSRLKMRPYGRLEEGFSCRERIGPFLEGLSGDSLFSLESNGLRVTRPSHLFSCYAGRDSKCGPNQVLKLSKLSRSSIGILSESKSHYIH